MFVFNDGRNDLRVHRQASLLGREGYQVRVYCFLEPGLPQVEKREHYTLHREDQRTRLARFLDDRVLSLLKRGKRADAAATAVEVPRVEDRKPVRPCKRPERRHLPAQASPAERKHRAYIRRVNRVWAEEAAAWKPDVCHAHDLDALEAAVLCARTCGAGVVYDAHELWSEQPFIGSQEAVEYWDALEAELIREARAVTTVNEPLARELEARYQVGPVVALHNCQELETPEPRKKLSDGRPVALYQGAYAPDRGLEEVIASAAYQDRVVIALRGFGEREAALRQMEGAERVLFLPPVPSSDVVSAAAEADIGLIPFLPTCLNHYLSTPNKLFEYMLAGLPMAGSDIPELQKFFGELEIGVLFDPHSPRDIARALVELAASEDLGAMGTRARKACQERYHWGVEGRKLLALYEGLPSRPLSR